MQALIIVDLQNDFLPGGALAVPEGDQIVKVINPLMERFSVVVATRDWHPLHHVSFASHHGRKVGELIETPLGPQRLWPDHCVEESHGAALAEKLHKEKISKIISKGTDPLVDSYSGFFDNARRHGTGLHDYLQSQNVSELYVTGLATDYCVLFTVLDALELGYKVYVVVDGCRAVNLNQDDGKNALERMVKKGASLINSNQL